MIRETWESWETWEDSENAATYERDCILNIHNCSEKAELREAEFFSRMATLA